MQRTLSFSTLFQIIIAWDLCISLNIFLNLFQTFFKCLWLQHFQVCLHFSLVGVQWLGTKYQLRLRTKNGNRDLELITKDHWSNQNQGSVTIVVGHPSLVLVVGHRSLWWVMVRVVTGGMSWFIVNLGVVFTQVATLRD